MTQTHTYMRDPVPADKCGQCACCLKHHRSSARGTLVRHGWKETGRQLGSYGCGFQWGPCNGWGMRPLEHTDADALEVLAKLDKSIEETREALAMHYNTGAAGYSYDFMMSAPLRGKYADKLAPIEARFAGALTSRGINFRVVDGVRNSSATQEYTYTVTIPRDFGGVKVTNEEVYPDDFRYMRTGAAISLPSYESRRTNTVRKLTALVQGMERQREEIKKAIVFHRENPSTGQADNKRTAVTHYECVHVVGTPLEKRMRRFVICGAGRRRGGRKHLLKTQERAAVTCSRCLKSMPPTSNAAEGAV